MYVKLDQNGRIESTTEYKEFAESDSIEFSFPDGFDFSKQIEYCIKDGELAHDPLPLSEEKKAAEKEATRREQLQTAAVLFVRAFANTLTDEQALSVSLLFEEWAAGKYYKKGDIIQHGDNIFRIGQDHTSQEQWIPGSEGTEALYSAIEITPEGYEEWKAWDGVSGIYAQGQIVKDPEDGNLYKSKISNNVWGPPHVAPDQWESYSECENIQ